MRQQIFLLASATAALAVQPSRVQVEQRDLEECMDVAQDFLPEITSIPIPNADPVDFLAFLAQQTHMNTYEDKCVIPTATGALTAEYTSWASALISWQQEHMTVIGDMVAACSDVPEVQEQLASLTALPICSTYSWEGGAPIGSAPTGSAPIGSAPTGSAPIGSAPTGSAPTGSAVSSNNANATATSTAGGAQSTTIKSAASRENGIAMAAVAVAGILAVAF